MAEYDLGTARGKVVVDASGAEYGFGRAKKASDDFDKSSRNSADAALKIGKGMAIAGTGIAAGLGLAIKSAADFEERLSGIRAVSGATESEMEQVRKKALQLGADTKYSAGESALAMEELIKAGLTTADVLNGAADATVNLAAAGEVDLPRAAEIAANAMNIFALKATDMPKVADLIAGAANASSLSVEDFAQSMNQAGAVANLVGLSFDDTAVAIAAMGKAGIKGSDAGTSLKTFLSNLQPVTKKQTELFKELGIVTENGANQFFTAEGKLKSMAEVSDVLQKALIGQTDQQKILTLETMFGSDAIRAAAIVADTGASGMNELAGAMSKVKAADVAATKMDNLKGSIEQLKGSAETFAIIFGTQMLGGLKRVVDQLTKAVNWFGNLSSGTQKTIGIVAAITAALLLLAGGLVIVVSAVSSVVAAFAALGVLGAVIGGVVIAIIALGVGLYLLYRRSETFREAVQSTWDWIKGNVVPIIQTVIAAIKSFVAALTSGFTEDEGTPIERIALAIRDAFMWIKDVAIPAVLGAFAAFMGWLRANVFPVFVEFKNLVIAVFNYIAPVVKMAFDILKAVFQAVLPYLITYWKFFWGNLVAALKFAWTIIKSVVEGALQVIKGIIQLITGVISGDWGKAWEGIKNIFGGIWNAIIGVLEGAVKFIVSIVKNFVGMVIGFFKNLWYTLVGGSIIPDMMEAIVKFFLWLPTKVIGIIAEFIASAIRFFASLPGKVLSALGDTGSLLVSKGRQLIEGFIRGYLAVIGQVWSFISGIQGEIAGFFAGAGSWLYNAGKRIIQGLIDGIRNMIGSVRSAIGEVTGVIGRFLPGSPVKEGPLSGQHEPYKLGQAVVEGLTRGLLRELGSVELASRAMATTMREPLQQISNNTTANAPVSVSFSFPGVTSSRDADEIKEALSSSEVLGQLTRSLRAGVGSNR